MRAIWERGYDRWNLRRKWRSLDVGKYYYVWVITRPAPGAPPPLRETMLINRAERVQEAALLSRLFLRDTLAAGFSLM